MLYIDEQVRLLPDFLEELIGEKKIFDCQTELSH